MLQMPPLETERLRIRPLAMSDLDAIYQILDLDLHFHYGDDTANVLAERTEWLEWTVRNYDALAKLYQLPYGERAVELRHTGELIGAVGYAPCFGPFGQLPAFGAAGKADETLNTTELGLFWAIASAHQGKGYATEAARAMINYAFTQLRLKRIIAQTEYTNAASQGVMRKLGMRVERNPYPDPPWFQISAVLEQ